MNIQKIFLIFALFIFVPALSAIDSAEGFAEEPKVAKTDEQSQSEQSERDCIKSKLDCVNEQIELLKRKLAELKNKSDKFYPDRFNLFESDRLTREEKFLQLPTEKQMQAREFAVRYSIKFLQLCSENPENRSCEERAEFLFQTILFNITPVQEERALLFEMIDFAATDLPNYSTIIVKMSRRIFKDNPEIVAWIDREKLLDKVKDVEKGKQAKNDINKICINYIIELFEKAKEEVEATLAEYDAQENEENSEQV
jgi:hypothetical protein